MGELLEDDKRRLRVAQGAWFKLPIKLLNCDRMCLALSMTPFALQALIRVMSQVSITRSLTIAMGDMDLAMGASKFMIKKEQFGKGIEALVSCFVDNDQDQLAIVWDREAGLMEVKRFDPYQDRYFGRIRKLEEGEASDWEDAGTGFRQTKEERNEERSAGRSASKELYAGGRKVGTPWGIYGQIQPENGAESKITQVVENLAGDNEKNGGQTSSKAQEAQQAQAKSGKSVRTNLPNDGHMDGFVGTSLLDHRLEIGDRRLEIGDRQSEERTTTTTNAENPEGEIEEKRIQEPRKEEACAHTFGGNGSQAHSLRETKREEILAGRVRGDASKTPEDVHLGRIAAFFSEARGEGAEALGRLFPDIELGYELELAEKWAIANVEDMIRFAAVRGWAEINLKDWLFKRFAKEQHDCAQGISPHRAAGEIKVWCDRVRRGLDGRPQAEVRAAVSSIAKGRGKVVGCECGWYGHRDALIAVDADVEGGAESLSDGAYRACPGCRREVMSA